MKNIVVYSGLVLLVLNSIAGLTLSSYNQFNWIAIDIIICLNVLLLFLLMNSQQKDGFKIGFGFLLPFLGLAQILAGFFLENAIKDNAPLLLILTLFSFQLICLLFGKFFTRYS